MNGSVRNFGAADSGMRAKSTWVVFPAMTVILLLVWDWYPDAESVSK